MPSSCSPKLGQTTPKSLSHQRKTIEEKIQSMIHRQSLTLEEDTLSVVLSIITIVEVDALSLLRL